MSFRDRLSQSLKDSMKARDEARTGALRLMLAEMKKRDIDSELKGGKALDESEILSMLQTMLKQRRESATVFEKAGRQDLLDKELYEINLIESFLPKQIGDEDAKAKIQAIIRDTGAQGVKDMGKVMAAVKEQLSGQYDMGKASALVKQALSAAA